MLRRLQQRCSCPPPSRPFPHRVATTPAVQVLFAGELQRRTGGQLISVAVHPGEVLTDVVRSLPGPVQRAYQLLLQAILLTPQQGAPLGWVAVGRRGCLQGAVRLHAARQWAAASVPPQ